MYIRVTPTPPLPPTKKIKAQCLLQTEIWHIICFAVKLHIQPMQTHKCFCTTHNMSTHKFECPAKNICVFALTLHWVHMGFQTWTHIVP